MSITLELRGQTRAWWPLTTSCLGQIERVGKTDARRASEVLFGHENTAPGTWRSVPRETLLAAVKELGAAGKKIPGGFEMLVPPFYPGRQPEPSWQGGGVSGMLIGGSYFQLLCKADHWILQSLDDAKAGKVPVRRYDAAEVATENMGTIKVRPKKSSHSDLSRVLRDVQKFLESERADEIRVVWG